MTNEQINVEIAEACGWTCVRKVHLRAIREDGFCGHPPGETHDAGVPDYYNDLNAMHSAENTLLKNDNHAHGCYCLYLFERVDNCMCATARQRAEAFLRVLGKWVD